MQSLVLLIWLAVCATQDARQRRISNALTFGAGALALIHLSVTGTTWLGTDAQEGLWAGVIALALTLPGYFMGRMGAGDVKLMTALGLATNGLFILCTFIGAGVASLLWLLIAPRVWLHTSQGLREHLRYMEPGVSKKQPFAPFVLVGVLLSVPWIH
ncbi:A24 family peptidase [Pseudomonas koreensis]|uniref:Type IV leader peptidase family n=1 Tax=Pseudomonas koreensis TaxID=198620 RepID=A0AA94EP20_9PSED|nr:prepilin peptidase [Pseudomonas koreensis]RVD77857.1 Type IV leader peptidase family [Pseudomonas koreensis]